MYAIVWDDVRTTHIASEVANGNVNRLRDKTGLPLASYFAGTKVKWLLDNIPELRQDLHDDLNRSSVRFGTIDTWLVYQLTGAKSPHDGAENLGGLCLTDVSNASRWLFLDLRAATWDPSLVDTVCAPHQLPLSALPIIRPSSNIYAVLSNKCGIPAFEKVPLASVLGDQQAALFGQACFRPGEAKNTYGTGMFLMMNTGEKMVPSNHGLLTTIGYQIGEDGELVYALEGSVSHSGSTVQWLRDQLGIISTASETETLATESNDGLYFVPAFAGLFAPHWRFDARACIVGMTASHHKGHICRAALEASAYQTREVFDAIYADSDVELLQLKVDGGATANSLLMQFQADMINVEVIRPVVMETTSIGAAFAAGLAVGVWSSTDEIKKLWAVAQVYSPNMEEEQRNRNWQGWQKAIEKSMGWVDDDGHVDCGEAQQSPDVESDLTQKVTEVEEADAEVLPAMQENENKGYSTVAVTAVAFSALMVGIVLGRVKK